MRSLLTIALLAIVAGQAFAVAPSCTPNGGSFSSSVAVTLNHDTGSSDFYVYYTTDGSTPTTASTSVFYGTQITIASSCTLKMLAKQADNSYATASTVFTIGATPPTAPGVSPGAGTYVGGQTITLTPPSGATAKYTTDGSTPSATAGTSYSAPFTLTSSATVKAVSVQSGLASSVASAAYTINPPPAPSISPAGGSFVGSVGVSVSATAGDTIEVNVSGTGWIAYSPFTLSWQGSGAHYTPYVLARATRNGVASSTTTVSFDITQADPPPGAPHISPGTGTYDGAQTVQIAAALGTRPGYSIYYSTDGSAPGARVYGGSFGLGPGTYTIKAMVVDDLAQASPVTTVDLTINAGSGGSYALPCITLTKQGAVDANGCFNGTDGQVNYQIHLPAGWQLPVGFSYRFYEGGTPITDTVYVGANQSSQVTPLSGIAMQAPPCNDTSTRNLRVEMQPLGEYPYDNGSGIPVTHITGSYGSVASMNYCIAPCNGTSTAGNCCECTQKQWDDMKAFWESKLTGGAVALEGKPDRDHDGCPDETDQAPDDTLRGCQEVDQTNAEKMTWLKNLLGTPALPTQLQATGYTMQLPFQIPGYGQYTAIVATIPDVTTLTGQQIDAARILSRGIELVLLHLFFVYRYYTVLRQW